MAAILNGEIDAAIIANQPTENQIQGDTLYYEQFFGYVAKNDPVFKKDMIRTADISDEHLWLLDEGHCSGKNGVAGKERSSEVLPAGTSLSTIVLLH